MRKVEFMKLKKDFTLEVHEVIEAFEFAQKIVLEENQSGLDFSNAKLPRKQVDKIADTFEGKANAGNAFHPVCTEPGAKADAEDVVFA